MTGGVVDLFSVFAAAPGGGNPCPVVSAADGLSPEDMLAIALEHGHESAFVLSPTNPDAAVRLRYFVPNHEMEMCVHATVAALTLLHEQGTLPIGDARVQTPLGLISATIDADGAVLVDQFPPTVDVPVPDAVSELAAAIGASPGQLAVGDVPRAVSVSRAKLLIELDSVATLNGLRPDPAAVREVCAALGVTGLYPFAVPVEGERNALARQFPRDSGYPEDAATGLAAAALAVLLGLRETEDGSYRYAIHQGHAMGRPSRITTHVTRTGGAITRIAVSGHAHRIDSASAPGLRAGQ